MTTPHPEIRLVESRPLKHGLTALLIRRCPDHPVDRVTNSGECDACLVGVEAYGRETA
ncbi:hypothetical protein [Dietzia sp. 111N12-1]|uniref:hypothetical protein n=1 Tax=Dietzia sp. 111N12-1 TaxID=1785156 RepID=UPI000AE089B1|nr:hypothetical protein [Dietzia sp. 111N12-1]